MRAVLTRIMCDSTSDEYLQMPSTVVAISCIAGTQLSYKQATSPTSTAAAIPMPHSAQEALLHLRAAIASIQSLQDNVQLQHGDITSSSQQAKLTKLAVLLKEIRPHLTTSVSNNGASEYVMGGGSSSAGSHAHRATFDLERQLQEEASLRAVDTLIQQVSQARVSLGIDRVVSTPRGILNNESGCSELSELSDSPTATADIFKLLKLAESQLRSVSQTLLTQPPRTHKTPASSLVTSTVDTATPPQSNTSCEVAVATAPPLKPSTLITHMPAQSAYTSEITGDVSTLSPPQASSPRADVAMTNSLLQSVSPLITAAVREQAGFQTSTSQSQMRITSEKTTPTSTDPQPTSLPPPASIREQKMPSSRSLTRTDSGHPSAVGLPHVSISVSGMSSVNAGNNVSVSSGGRFPRKKRSTTGLFCCISPGPQPPWESQTVAEPDSQQKLMLTEEAMLNGAVVKEAKRSFLTRLFSSSIRTKSHSAPSTPFNTDVNRSRDGSQALIPAHYQTDLHTRSSHSHTPETNQSIYLSDASGHDQALPTPTLPLCSRASPERTSNNLRPRSSTSVELTPNEFQSSRGSESEESSSQSDSDSASSTDAGKHVHLQTGELFQPAAPDSATSSEEDSSSEAVRDKEGQHHVGGSFLMLPPMSVAQAN